jgi:hypothetical protein
MVRLRDCGPFGPDATAHQQTPSLRALGYSGVNPWDRTRAGGLKDGSWRYQYEDVVTATGVTAGDLRGVRSWVDAPYHRFPLLDVNTRHVGWAVSSRKVAGRRYSAKVLEMAATWKDRDKRSPSTRPPARRPCPSRSTAPGAPDPVPGRTALSLAWQSVVDSAPAGPAGPSATTAAAARVTRPARRRSVDPPGGRGGGRCQEDAVGGNGRGRRGRPLLRYRRSLPG